MVDTEIFIKRANKKHNNKYDYSKTKYVNYYTKVCIICPKHGEFWQLPDNHLRTNGCIYCSGKAKKTTEIWIKEAKKMHGDKYDYSKTEYINAKSKVCIICPEHGEFWQNPNKHINGQGCPKCGKISMSKKQSLTTDKFILKANKIHGDKYDYSKVEYNDSHSKVIITCPKHGDFLQIANDHLRGEGCPICGRVFPQGERDILNIIKTYEYKLHNKTILNGKEIDIYIPSLNLGIEYNGLRWHSENFGKDKNYHLDKLNKCNEQGIRLIQIFEDEWVNHREICESKLKQICDLNTNPKIYGRKCEIHEIMDKNEAYEFLDKNHIQGRTGCTIALGAYYDGKMVGVMTFKKEKDDYWDLNRFATDINYHCIGIGGKLFKYFTRNYPFIEIKSFADRRWTTDPNNNLYTKLGFEFNSYVPPSYWYYNKKINQYKRFHKFGFRKQHLHKQYDLPLTMTEREMTESLGYTRIWDCGLIKYIFKKNGNK